MAELVSSSIDIVRIKLNCGEYLTSTLLLPSKVSIGSISSRLANSFANAAEKELIEQGDYLRVMRYSCGEEIKKANISVILERKKNSMLYPELILSFDYFYVSVWKGYFVGFVPTLGIESFGCDIQELEHALCENIKLEFARKKRLKSVRSIVETQWFEEISVCREKIQLSFYTLYELQNLQAYKKEKWLGKVATEMQIYQRQNFGRPAEWDLLKKAFRVRYQKNILLVGAKGCGKTTLVKEIVRRQSDLGIKSKFWETNASTMIQELTGDGGWQENLHKVCREIQVQQGILFVHNISELFDVGKYIGNSTSIAEYLREYLQRGEIQIVAECTEEELAAMDAECPGYSTLFQIITFEKLTDKQLREIIVAKINLMAKMRNIRLEEKAINEIIRLQKRYTPYSGFPGKTIRFIESLFLNREEKSESVKRNEILNCFCEETGMPSFLIDPEVDLPVNKIQDFFSRHIFGQGRAISTVVDLLSMVKTFLTRQNKPIASLLFIGPTGVGKTEMTKVLAEYVFGRRTKVTRFDMSEYSDLYSVMRLTGEHRRGEGLLTSSVRQNPFSVILFDELEKAHYSFYDLLLQILGEGRLTDAKGKMADFCSTIIIMTSNIGAKNFDKGRASFDKEQQQTAQEHFIYEVQKYFRPELFNRIDQIVPFASLSKDIIANILEREIALIKKRQGIQFRHLKLDIDKKAKEYFVNKGYNAKYGARELQRTLREYLVLPLAKKINAYETGTLLCSTVTFDKSLQINLNVIDDVLPVYQKIANSKETLRSISSKAHEYRNIAQILKESYHYSNIKNQFEILERKKKKLKDGFWKETELSTEYRKLSEILAHTNSVIEEIADLEINISMAYLQSEELSAGIVKKITEWLREYMEVKILLHSVFNEKDNNILLGMYGDEKYLIDMQKTYYNIAQRYSFSVISKLLWLRTEYYEKLENFAMMERDLIAIEEWGSQEEFEKERQKIQKMKEQENIENDSPYIKTPFSSIFTPPKKNDKCVGLEMQIQGNCAYLLFKEEEGIHSWKKGEEENKYMIHISRETFKDYVTPNNIFRKIIFKDRKITREHLIKNIKNYRERYENIIYEHLSRIFKSKIDNLIFSEKK